MEVQDYQILDQYSDDWSGAPANCWLLCLIYVCYLLNHIASAALDGEIPHFALTGMTPDISIICFSLSTNLCSMQHMTNIFPLKVKRELQGALW